MMRKDGRRGLNSDINLQESCFGAFPPESSPRAAGAAVAA